MLLGMNPVIDRREGKRFDILGTAPATLAMGEPVAPTIASAWLVEIGSNGALIKTNSRLDPGQSARFDVVLDHEVFSTRVEVVRVEPSGQEHSIATWVAALRFVGTREHDTAVLARFLTH